MRQPPAFKTLIPPLVEFEPSTHTPDKSHEEFRHFRTQEPAISRGVGMTTQIYAERAENAEIWDVEGRRYIDFAAGIAVVNTGHRHPKVIAAVQAQLDRFTHTCHQVVPYESYVRLAERLNGMLPGKFEKKTVFVTTGAEAVENAVKIARHRDRPLGGHRLRRRLPRPHLHGHGADRQGPALQGRLRRHDAGDVFHVPFPIALHGVSVADALAALDKLFKADLDPARVAAIIIEPVQGEGGFYEAPRELMRGAAQALRRARHRADRRRGADRLRPHRQAVRDGALRRRGRPHLMAKGLAGGFPLAAVTGRAEIMDAPNPGGLGGTYGGNPLGIAAAHAVLDVIEEEELCDRANALGARLRQRLQSLRDDVPEIAEIRGPGFMVAVEFNDVEEGTAVADFANRGPAGGAGQGPDPAHLRRLRQRHPLPRAHHHPGRRDERGARHSRKLDPRSQGCLAGALQRPERRLPGVFRPRYAVVQSADLAVRQPPARPRSAGGRPASGLHHPRRSLIHAFAQSDISSGTPELGHGAGHGRRCDQMSCRRSGPSQAVGLAQSELAIGASRRACFLGHRGRLGAQ